MKRIIMWLFAISLVVFTITWGVVGLKILDGDYEVITVGAYIALACWAVMFVCVLCKYLSNRCPHCGKWLQTNGRYCPYCGKEV